MLDLFNNQNPQGAPSSFNLQGNPNAMILGLSLLSSPDFKTGAMNGLSSLGSYQQQAAQHAAQQAQQQQQFELEKLKFLQSQQQFGQNFGLQQKEQTMKQEDINRKLNAGKNISGIIGEEPSMVNDWQGSGYLGNGGKIDPLMRARLMAAQELAQTGDVQNASSYLPQPEKASFGQPIPVKDSQGKLTYVMTDNTGTVKPVENFTPVPNRNTATPFEAEIAKKDAETLQKSRDAISQAIPMRNSLIAFKEAIQKVPSSMQGKFIGKIAPYISADAQAAQAPANQVALLAKSLLGMPSNTFSEADRNFLVSATVGLTNEPKANKFIIDKLEKMLDQAVRYNEGAENSIATKGNLNNFASEFYNQEYGKNKTNDLNNNLITQNQTNSNISNSNVPTFSEQTFAERDRLLNLPKGTSALQYKSRIGQRR
jgi:hypothetical protein